MESPHKIDEKKKTKKGKKKILELVIIISTIQEVIKAFDSKHD